MTTTPRRRAFLGFLFLIIGAVLLIHWSGLFHFFSLPSYLFSWKMILIVLGVFLLTTEKNRSTGLILLVIGSVFLSRDIFGIEFWQIMRFAVPALFLIIGIMLIFPRRRRLSKGRRFNQFSEEESGDSINDVHIFSGGSKAITSESFQGGEITCIFGGTELNFKNARLAEGNNVIDVTCIFGGITFYVPSDWTVRVDVTPVFGGFSDSRAESNTSIDADPDKLLVIRGTVIFGGGEVKFV